MEFIDITALEQLSPQDHLRYMQGVWAYVVELAPEHLKAKESFIRFSSVLNEFEKWVVYELNDHFICEQEILFITNQMKEQMNMAYETLISDLEEKENMDSLDLL